MSEDPTSKDEDFVKIEADESSAASTSMKDQIKVHHFEEKEERPKPLAETSDPHPVQALFTSAAKNTTKTVQKVAKDIQGWSDEHVKPHFDKFGQSTKAVVDTHVAPHVENVKANTSKTMESIGSSTRNVIDTHVAPNVESFKQNSARTMESLSTSTRNVMENHVKPNYESIKANTSKKVEEISTSTREAYVKKVQPHVDATMSKAKLYSPYYMNTAPALFDNLLPDVWYMHVVEGSCRSYGQVMFCNNPVTGAFVWLALLFASPLAALCSLLCVGAANMSALYLGMGTVAMRSGTFAYNAVLVGSGIATFLTFGWGFFSAMLLSILAGPLVLLAYVYTASIVAWPLHLPANGVLVLLLLSAVVWDSTTVVAIEETGGRFLAQLLDGLSGMYLLKGAFSGLLVLVGMVLCSRILAAAAVAGSLLGIFLGWLFGWGGGANAALTCAALTMYVVMTKKSMVLALSGGLLALVTHSAVEALFTILMFPMTTMTLPFCLATLPILISLDSDTFCGGSMELIPPTELSTPELYLAAHAPVVVEDEEEVKVAEGEESAGGKEEAPATEETPLMAKSEGEMAV